MGFLDIIFDEIVKLSEFPHPTKLGTLSVSPECTSSKVYQESGVIVRSPRLELQLKSTSRDVLDDNQLRYPLKIKNYNDLRLPDFAIPRILVVLVLPENLTDWLQQSEAELCMRYCAYWVSLRGMPDTKNTATVTVSLPRSHQFTVSALQLMMQRLSQGVLL